MSLTKIKGAIFDGPISVKDFGAIGDGVADDTVAIQDAIDALPSARSDLYFPAGKYILSAQLTHTNAPIKMFGAGIEVTILEWTSGASTRGILITQDIDLHHTEISGMTLNTLGVAVGTAITINMAGQIDAGLIQNRLNMRVILRDISMQGGTDRTTDAWNWGVEFVDVMHSIIDHCFVLGKRNTPIYTNTSAGGFHFSGAGLPTVIQLTRCFVYFGLDGLLAENYEGITLTDCNFVVCTRGLKLTDSDSGNGLFFTVDNTHFSCFENCVTTTGGTTALQMTGCYMLARTDGNNAVNFVFLSLDDIKNSKFVDLTFNAAGATYTTRVGIDLLETTGETKFNDIVRPFMQNLTIGTRIASGVADTNIREPFYSVVTTEVSDSGTGTIVVEDTVTKIKTADEEVVNSAVFQTDDHLTGWTLKKASRYLIKGYFKCDSDTSTVPEIKIGLKTTQVFQNSDVTASRVTISGATDFDRVSDMNVDTSGGVNMTLLASDAASIEFTGSVHTHATLDATVDVQWSQGISNATRTRVRNGSWWTFTRLGQS